MIDLVFIFERYLMTRIFSLLILPLSALEIIAVLESEPDVSICFKQFKSEYGPSIIYTDIFMKVIVTVMRS